jgi:hypothetical protein
MLLRSLLLLAGLLLLVAALANIVAPREVTNRNAGTAPVLTPPVADAVEPAVSAALRWELPGRRLLRAKVGDVVEITVASDTRDVAELPQLGVDAPVEAGMPATLRFVADQPGRFSVLLRYAQRKLGVLQVEPAAS